MLLLKRDKLTQGTTENWFADSCHVEFSLEDNEWNLRHAALRVDEWVGKFPKDINWASVASAAVHCQMALEGQAGKHDFDSYNIAEFLRESARVLAIRNKAEELRLEFEVLSKHWLRDTKHFSQISKKVTHFAFLRIIAMGYGAVPLILEALRDNPAHWFVALSAITHENPAPEQASPMLAREAWLNWGRNEGLLD